MVTVAAVKALIIFAAKKGINVFRPHSLEFFIEFAIKAAIIWFLAFLRLPPDLPQIVGSRFGQPQLLLANFHGLENITMGDVCNRDVHGTAGAAKIGRYLPVTNFVILTKVRIHWLYLRVGSRRLREWIPDQVRDDGECERNIAT